MRFLRSACVVMIFWLVLAMPVGAGGYAWGLLVAALIGWWATVFLWPDGGPGIRARLLPQLLVHLLSLLKSIVPAALQLSGILLHRRLSIRPQVITYTTRLTSAAARAALANSITLTPGTHCVDIDGQELTVHCLAPGFADALVSGQAEAQVRRAFEPEASP